MPSKILLLLGCFIAASAQQSVHITPGSATGHIDENTPAVTFDYWLHNDTKYGEKWGNGSILTIDLQDPNLRALAKGLSPGLLRLGGSPVDSVLYDVGGCQPGGTGPSSDYYCSQVHPYVYGCLSPNRWEEILGFAKDVGIKILMGVNCCYGRPSANETMDFSNIKAFLAATKALGPDVISPLIGFEFGNEVSGGSAQGAHAVTAAAYAKDAAVLRQLVEETFGKGRMVVAGPADAPKLAERVATKAAGALDVITYHQYPQCVPQNGSNFILEPTCLQALDTIANQTSSIVAAQHENMVTWAGETADHWGGGVAGVTDTFQDVFYYTWQLSSLPLHDVGTIARQCFVGGDYELLDRVTFQPNPSYYIARFFREYISVPGNRPVEVSVSEPYTTTGMRVFGFSNGMYAAVNTHMTAPYTVNVAGSHGTISIWAFTTSDVKSKEIMLNGNVLNFAGAVPPMPPQMGTLPMTVPPASVTFFKV